MDIIKRKVSFHRKDFTILADDLHKAMQSKRDVKDVETLYKDFVEAAIALFKVEDAFKKEKSKGKPPSKKNNQDKSEHYRKRWIILKAAYIRYVKSQESDSTVCDPFQSSD